MLKIKVHPNTAGCSDLMIEKHANGDIQVAFLDANGWVDRWVLTLTDGTLHVADASGCDVSVQEVDPMKNPEGFIES